MANEKKSLVMNNKSLTICVYILLALTIINFFLIFSYKSSFLSLFKSQLKYNEIVAEEVVDCRERVDVLEKLFNGILGVNDY